MDLRHSMHENHMINKAYGKSKQYNAERDEFMPPKGNSKSSGRSFYLSNLHKRLYDKHNVECYDLLLGSAKTRKWSS